MLSGLLDFKNIWHPKSELNTLPFPSIVHPLAKKKYIGIIFKDGLDTDNVKSFVLEEENEKDGGKEENEEPSGFFVLKDEERLLLKIACTSPDTTADTSACPPNQFKPQRNFRATVDLDFNFTEPWRLFLMEMTRQISDMARQNNVVTDYKERPYRTKKRHQKKHPQRTQKQANNAKPVMRFKKTHR